MVGGALETERERSTKKKVVVSVDCHFVLELAEMERVGGSRVAIEGGHHKFSQE